MLAPHDVTLTLLSNVLQSKAPSCFFFWSLVYGFGDVGPTLLPVMRGRVRGRRRSSQKEHLRCCVHEEHIIALMASKCSQAEIVCSFAIDVSFFFLFSFFLCFFL